MKRVLGMILASAVVAAAFAAEIRRESVPTDRVPWELSKPRLKKGVWWDAPHIPLDHPYWWTLSEGLSPEQLRHELEKRVAALESEERENVAAAAASTPEPRIVRIVDGQQTPHLFPLWSIFYSFASGKTSEGSEEVLRELAAYGIEPSAAESIVEAARETLKRADEVGQQAGSAALQLRSLLRQANEQIGSDRVAELKRTADFALLSEKVGWSESSLEDLARNAYRNWEAEAAVPSILSLRSKIGEQQWRLFRGYLLAEVATRRSDTVILR